MRTRAKALRWFSKLKENLAEVRKAEE